MTRTLFIQLFLSLQSCYMLTNVYAQEERIITFDGVKVKTTNTNITTQQLETIDSIDYFTISVENPSEYQLPSSFKKPEKWIKAEQRRKERSINQNNFENYSIGDALAAIDTAQSLSRIIEARTWCMDHYTVIFHHLIARLGTKRNVGLNNTADLIIWDRIQTGDLQFYGHGWAVQEDLFTIAGRASWILNSLTGENFAIVNVSMNQKQAIAFMQQWKTYVKNNTF